MHVRKCCVYEKGNMEDLVAKLPCRTGPSKLLSKGGMHTCVGINRQVLCWVMSLQRCPSQAGDQIPQTLTLHTCAEGLCSSPPEKTLLYEGFCLHNLKTSPLQATHPFYPWKLIKPCFCHLQELVVCLLWPRMDWSSIHYPTCPGE